MISWGLANSGAQLGKVRPFSRGHLKVQNGFGFLVQSRSLSVKYIAITSVFLVARQLRQVIHRCVLDKIRAVLEVAKVTVNFDQQLFRECDGCLYFHTTIIP